MKFIAVVQRMRQLENTSKQTEMISILAELFREADADSIGEVCYWLVGQIGPDYKELQLGMGDKMILSALALASGEEVSKIEDKQAQAGDLGDVAVGLEVKKLNPFEEIWQVEEPLTVSHISEALDRIAQASGSGSQEVKKKTLASLLIRSSPEERRYVTRLVAGTMRLGVGDMTVLDGLATAFLGGKEDRPPLEHAYNVSSDLGHVAEVLLTQGEEGVCNIEVSLNRPLKPMLAQRVSKISDIEEKIDTEKISAEAKYDGERIQVHKDGSTIRLFSRRLTDVTHQFPDVVRGVKKCLHVNRAILDGEAVAYDAGEGAYFPFQKLMRRRRKYDVEEYAEEIPVRYLAFDLLYHEGESFLRQGYPYRRKKLAEIIKPSDKVALSDRIVTDSTDEIETFFEESLEKGLEGLVCKSYGEESYYRAGARAWSWIKWKKDYSERLSDTLDLVVVGAYPGKGARSGGYGSLLCATYHQEKDTFQTLCRLGAGFTDEQLAKLEGIFAEHAVDDKPARLEATKDVEPYQWFVPRIVVEVLGSEITQSPVHTCGLPQLGRGLALRFPRFQRFRDDKDAGQATTTAEVIQMYEDQ